MDEEATTTVESPPTESEVQADAIEQPATGDATVTEMGDADSAGEESGEPGPIPYTRFKEVNDQLRELKQMKEQEAQVLREFGFNNLEEMRQAAALEQQRMEEQNIASYFQRQVDEGELDEQTASLRQAVEMERLQIARERAQLQAYLVQQERANALASNPAAQQAQDMVDDLIASGLPPQLAVQKVAQMVERFNLAAQTQAVKQNQSVAPAPMSTSNQSAQPTRPMNPLDAWRQGASRPWREILAGSKDTV
jgi:vacuolar-type H+-ATPase subunit I/STV1